jgi:hypothetical protein
VAAEFCEEVAEYGPVSVKWIAVRGVAANYCRIWERRRWS